MERENPELVDGTAAGVEEAAPPAAPRTRSGSKGRKSGKGTTSKGGGKKAKDKEKETSKSKGGSRKRKRAQTVADLDDEAEWGGEEGGVVHEHDQDGGEGEGDAPPPQKRRRFTRSKSNSRSRSKRSVDNGEPGGPLTGAEMMDQGSPGRFPSTSPAFTLGDEQSPGRFPSTSPAVAGAGDGTGGMSPPPPMPPTAPSPESPETRALAALAEDAEPGWAWVPTAERMGAFVMYTGEVQKSESVRSQTLAEQWLGLPVPEVDLSDRAWEGVATARQLLDTPRRLRQRTARPTIERLTGGGGDGRSPVKAFTLVPAHRSSADDSLLHSLDPKNGTPPEDVVDWLRMVLRTWLARFALTGRGEVELVELDPGKWLPLPARGTASRSSHERDWEALPIHERQCAFSRIELWASPHAHEVLINERVNGVVQRESAHIQAAEDWCAFWAALWKFPWVARALGENPLEVQRITHSVWWELFGRVRRGAAPSATKGQVPPFARGSAEHAFGVLRVLGYMLGFQMDPQKAAVDRHASRLKAMSPSDPTAPGSVTVMRGAWKGAPLFGGPGAIV